MQNSAGVICPPHVVLAAITQGSANAGFTTL
jgi:hypothetical protein